MQFYESDEFLVASLARFSTEGLQLGESVIIIGTEAHRRGLAEALAGSGVDLSAARRGGRYISIDAATTLGNFMVDGDPDFDRVKEALIPVIDAASEAGTRVRIFGEMVALLWDEGNVSAAISLEEMWNEVGKTHAFSLFCAYPMKAFSQSGTDEPFRQVCEAHSHVIPAESFTQESEDSSMNRAVATLQQTSTAREFEARALRAERVRLKAMIEQARELERVREESLQMIAHDLRNPITVIGGFVEMLKDNRESLPEESIDEFLSLVLSNTNQMSKLIDDILLVSSLESQRFTYELGRLDIAELVYRAVAGVRQTNPQISFEVHVTERLPLVLGDETRQLQILNNLLSNAAKYSPRGAVVSIEVARLEAEIIVKVRDEGPGIAEAQRHRLFQRFSRLDHARHQHVKGTGLGLYISKSLAEGQGGRIWCESQEGRGSTFSYTVPIVR